MKDEKIFIKRSEVKRLADIFGVSEVMVYMSLRYDRDSELAKKIRHTALKSKADFCCGVCRECVLESEFYTGKQMFECKANFSRISSNFLICCFIISLWIKQVGFRVADESDGTTSFCSGKCNPIFTWLGSDCLEIRWAVVCNRLVTVSGVNRCAVKLGVKISQDIVWDRCKS